MAYSILVSETVQKFLQDADTKTERICREHLTKLSNPYPGRGGGDKEKIVYKSGDAYRLHIGRTWTAFYLIDEDNNNVHVIDILPIDIAHKKYGEL